MIDDKEDLSIAKLLFATGNKGKLRDAEGFFAESKISIISPEMAQQECGLLSPPPEVEETGTTYHENAALKVQALYDWCGLPAFADDSGIEVAALNGAPGLISARWAGEGCTYQDNINKMLHEMTGVANRDARFVCVIAYTLDGKSINFIEGYIAGTITNTPRGEGGFGYDPIFQVDGTDYTLAELKSGIAGPVPDTHRTRAFKQLVTALMV
jgi:XTP/dITP diphosphohydrolase